MIVMVYIISVVELIVMRIFNFIHRFDDYDGFGDFLKHLLLGPLTLVVHTIHHFVHLLGCIYGIIRRKINPNWTNAPSYTTYEKFDSDARQTNKTDNVNANVSVNDERYKTLFVDMINKEAKALASRPPLGDYIHSSSIYVEWEYGRANVSVSPWGRITFSGKIIFKNSLSSDETEYDKRHIEDCVNKTADLLKERMSDAIDALRTEYKGYDKSYSIDANLSYKTINMRLS